MINVQQQPLFIYTYAYREEEASLCRLEMRSFFEGKESYTSIMMSDIAVEPHRSPFLRERLEVLYEGDTLPQIWEQVEQLVLADSTFKVIYIKTNDLAPEDKIEFDDQRVIEREIGIHIDAEADMHQPDYTYGIITVGGRWYFGHYVKSKAIWLEHMQKPRNYSIALSTRDARAIANIAVPHPEGIKAIDPCCGIGTVLIEAMSMGIDIVGRDINQYVVQGTLENLEHFGLATEVVLGDIAEVDTTFDVAIIDMPYNHYSRTTPEEQLSLLKQGHRIADRIVLVTNDGLEEMIAEAGLTIRDRGFVRKGNFVRQIIVCTK